MPANEILSWWEYNEDACPRKTETQAKPFLELQHVERAITFLFIQSMFTLQWKFIIDLGSLWLPW